MRIPDFELERYFARWEFAVDHLLCASDVEGYPMAELLALADDETRALWAGLRLGYTESTGHPLLRREIAALYDRVEPDEVLVFAGAEEGIFCLANVMLGPGDHAIVTWPGYQSLYEVARAVGADVTLHELHAADGWSIDVERLRASLRPSTRLVVVNAPHNPTGMLPTHAEWRALTNLCADAGVHLLADEVYRFLEFDPADRLAAGVEAFDRGISLGVLSKSFALAGLRIGWLATHDRFFAERSDRFSWVRPRAGSIGFPRLSAAGVTIDAFAEELVEAEGVLLLPGSRFGYPGDHFRIGFGRTDLPEALAGLEHFADRRLA
jgi:aspartate/methionine/tyrosine aminotransferase